MKLTITIEMDNAAFDGGSMARRAEVRRIIRAALKQRPSLTVGNDFNLRDSNGNTVGRWEVSE